MSKAIGFIDYYISEWHANNYPGWMREICEAKGLDYCVKYAWAEMDVSPVDGKDTDTWCAEFGVEKCATIEELCEKSDAIVILAPSNPEKHLEYAKAAFNYKKPVYIDKTFAPDYASAKAIFDLGEKTGTKFFSTSALRYADELAKLEPCESMVITGGGRSLEEYIIHQIEMLVSLMDAEPIAAKVENHTTQYTCKVDFANGKNAFFVFGKMMPFSICTEQTSGDSEYVCMQSDFFKNLMAEILNFFETGTLPFDSNQTLRAMKIRDAVLRAAQTPGVSVEI